MQPGVGNEAYRHSPRVELWDIPLNIQSFFSPPFALCFVEVLFGILFACFCRLSDFLAYFLPLVVVVLFDSVEERRTFVLSEFRIVHILVPVLLDTSFRSTRKGLCDLCPAAASISHSLQPLFFSRRPRSICPALFRWGTYGGRGRAGFIDACWRSRST